MLIPFDTAHYGMENKGLPNNPGFEDDYPWSNTYVHMIDDAPTDQFAHGYRLVDVTDGHVWLEFGTYNTEDYYPYFVFRHNPKPPPREDGKTVNDFRTWPNTKQY